MTCSWGNVVPTRGGPTTVSLMTDTLDAPCDPDQTEPGFEFIMGRMGADHEEDEE